MHMRNIVDIALRTYTGFVAFDLYTKEEAHAKRTPHNSHLDKGVKMKQHHHPAVGLYMKLQIVMFQVQKVSPESQES